MIYTVKNIKSFRGREGYGFNADLLLDGVKVAFVMDSGNGGCFRYEWVNNDHSAEKAFEDFAKADPRLADHSQEHGDGLMAILIDAEETVKKTIAMTKRALKNALIFQVDGGELRSIPFKKAADVEARKYVWMKYPGKKVVILNDMKVEDAAAIYVKIV